MAGKEHRSWVERQPRWLLAARCIAVLVLLDQAIGLSNIESSQAIVVACIGALFAPVPTDKRKD